MKISRTILTLMAGSAIALGMTVYGGAAARAGDVPTADELTMQAFDEFKAAPEKQTQAKTPAPVISATPGFVRAVPAAPVQSEKLDDVPTADELTTQAQSMPSVIPTIPDTGNSVQVDLQALGDVPAMPSPFAPQLKAPAQKAAAAKQADGQPETLVISSETNPPVDDAPADDMTAQAPTLSAPPLAAVKVEEVTIQPPPLPQQETPPPQKIAQTPKALPPAAEKVIAEIKNVPAGAPEPAEPGETKSFPVSMKERSNDAEIANAKARTAAAQALAEARARAQEKAEQAKAEEARVKAQQLAEKEKAEQAAKAELAARAKAEELAAREKAEQAAKAELIARQDAERAIAEARAKAQELAQREMTEKAEKAKLAAREAAEKALADARAKAAAQAEKEKAAELARAKESAQSALVAAAPVDPVDIQDVIEETLEPTPIVLSKKNTEKMAPVPAQKPDRETAAAEDLAAIEPASGESDETNAEDTAQNDAVPVPGRRPDIQNASIEFVERARRTYRAGEVYRVSSHKERGPVTGYDTAPQTAEPARVADTSRPIPNPTLSVADLQNDPLARQMVNMSADDIAAALNRIESAAGTGSMVKDTRPHNNYYDEMPIVQRGFVFRPKRNEDGAAAESSADPEQQADQENMITETIPVPPPPRAESLTVPPPPPFEPEPSILRSASAAVKGFFKKAPKQETASAAVETMIVPDTIAPPPQVAIATETPVSAPEAPPEPLPVAAIEPAADESVTQKMAGIARPDAPRPGHKPDTAATTTDKIADDMNIAMDKAAAKSAAIEPAAFGTDDDAVKTGASAPAAAVSQKVDAEPVEIHLPGKAAATLTYQPGSGEMSETDMTAQAGAIAEKLKSDPALRVQIVAFATPVDNSQSGARRISLSRALSVRTWLMDQGVEATRMDVRALGVHPDGEAVDSVDMIFIDPAAQ